MWEGRIRFFMDFNQHCFICHTTDSTVSEDAAVGRRIFKCLFQLILQLSLGGLEHGALVQQILRITELCTCFRLGKLSLGDRSTVPSFTRSCE